MTYLAIAIYATAIILANLVIAQFGPGATPFTAFVLIGLDLALRNWLSLRIGRVAMAVMILGTGLLSYMVNPASGAIALASGVAFTLAAIADWATFNSTAGGWMRRNLAGNSVGALVDSIVFPTLAFGALMPTIMLAQFIAKVSGGSLWGYLIYRSTAKHLPHN